MRLLYADDAPTDVWDKFNIPGLEFEDRDGRRETKIESCCPFRQWLHRTSQDSEKDTEVTQHPYLFLIQAKRVMPLDEIPKGHASIISLLLIGLAVFVLVHFNHVGAAISGRKWREDSATENEWPPKVITNTIALLV